MQNLFPASLRSNGIGILVIFTPLPLLLTGTSASRKPLLGSKSPDSAFPDPDLTATTTLVYASNWTKGWESLFSEERLKEIGLFLLDEQKAWADFLNIF